MQAEDKAMLRMRMLPCIACAAISCASVSLASAEEAAIPADNFVYCTVCHGVQMRGNELLSAPRVSQMEAWYVRRQLEAFKSGWRGSHGNDYAGMEMRPMAAILTAEEIDEVANYVTRVSSPLPEATVAGDVDKGEALYATCIACHGAKAEGNEALNAPALSGRNDWYLVTQLKNYKAGIRGTHADDIVGNQMRAATGTLPDDDAINDVVAYLNTLQSE